MPVWVSTAKMSGAPLGGQGTNTWHFRTVGALEGLPDAQALTGATENLRLFYDNVKGLLSAGVVVSHDGIWRRVDDDSGDVHDSAGWSVGASGNDSLPPQISLVIGWRTGSGDRSGKGRTFLGPIARSTLEVNGTPEETSRATAAAAAAALIESSDENTGNGAFCVWSKQESLARDFTTAAVRNVYGTLRSRRD